MVCGIKFVSTRTSHGMLPSIFHSQKSTRVEVEIFWTILAQNFTNSTYMRVNIHDTLNWVFFIIWTKQARKTILKQNKHLGILFTFYEYFFFNSTYTRVYTVIFCFLYFDFLKTYTYSQQSLFAVLVFVVLTFWRPKKKGTIML